MAYIRGDYYIWADESKVHVWARDGYDDWDKSVWNESAGRDRDAGKTQTPPSGVAVPFDVLDEFVVMRIAKLLECQELTRVVTRTIEKCNGNGGCYALTRLGDALKRLG